VMAAQGVTTAEIAARLSLSGRTVEAYRARMMRKLGLRSQMDLIRYALRQGLIALDD
jgi:two-component system, NarL family, response regulator NreC